MSAYLAKLKRLEFEKEFQYTPGGEPSKPSKAPFEPFEGTHPAHIEKKTKVASPEADPLPDPAMEARRQRVLAMLAERPDTRYAVLVDNPDIDPVIVALGIRGQATCELRIPREKYDPILFLEAVERHSVP